jgi:uncharacterized protein (TIGR02231 family)
MKKALFLFVTAIIASMADAQSPVKSVDTSISDVTVFQSGAQVTHTANVLLKEGENLLRISDLTLYLDPNSIQVEGNPNYVILSVRHQVNYLLDGYTNPKVKAIQDSLEDALFKQKELAGLKDALIQEKTMLEYNRTMKGENTLVLPEDLKDMADFFRARFTEISYKWIELGEQERKNNIEINRLQSTLNDMNARKGSNPSEILITVIASKAASAPVKVTYFAQNAGWYPVYDLRADDINSPIEFAYRAKVYQSTGTDWEKVNLTISTGNPTIGGQIPTLYPWFINIYEPLREVTITGRGDMAPAAAYDQMEDMDSYKEKKTMYASNYVAVQNNTVNTAFKISVPYSIPSDNQHYDVVMQKESLKAEYAYITIPKLDTDAFLRARVTDWAQYSLLPGESNIYFKGTSVGKGFIDPALANDTLSLSLGRDKSINVKRDMIKDYCKTTFFGGKQKTSKAYEITVQNNKKQSIQIEIEDQLPISQNSDVEVETEEISGAQYDETTGKLTWKLTLAPGETVKKQVRFNVKYPKKKYVSGL